MAREKLVDYKGLEGEVGIPVRTLRTLAQRRVIPCFRLGHRTVMFSPGRVIAALDRYEVHSIGAAKGGKGEGNAKGNNSAP